ncbi:9723_t:CDS:2 [Gigaspora margarita]|uniref:9723_t:CDS:1 n=1 Tax=Gigaspora margarita TaxID=4874 RepID=A0ABN7W597_GIGMA|nr:9723_t:CDS:2 [Gigaspora margarita]
MKFNFKKLNEDEAIQFNQQIIAKLEYILFDKNSLSKKFWAEFNNKAIYGAFEQKPVFKGLCHIMLQAAEHEEQDKGLQNLKYSNEFLNFLVILGSISLKALNLFHQNLTGITIRTKHSDNAINNSDLCYKNVAHFKRLLDILYYKGPVVAMTDCTKVKSGLHFSSSLDCIVESTLNQNDCIIKTYNDIYDKVSNIKQKNAIAKYVRVYAL